MFPQPLTSARKQWFQRTYAMVPNGNWDGSSFALAILDSGEVWLYMAGRLTSFSNAINWDEFGFQDNPGEGDNIVWIGKVSPEGSIRVSGDQLVYGEDILDLDTSWAWDAPRASDTHLSRSAFNWTSNTAQMITDGTSLYIYQDYGMTGAPQWRGWYKVNPITYEFHRMAGSTNAALANEDSPDGSLASFNTLGQGVVHEGYIYFPSTGHWPGPNARFGLWSLRRMSLTAPYGVETVYEWDNPGGGYPYDSGANNNNYLWLAATNSSTGLLNMFNDDILMAAGLPADGMPMAKWGDYFYFLSFAVLNQEPVRVPYAIRRAPITGGPMETLFWGIGNLGTNTQTPHRDTEFDSQEYPLGVQAEHVWPTYNPVLYGREWTVEPYYEGFWPFVESMAITDEGNLFISNIAPGLFASGYNEYGRTMCKFHLPTLIAEYEANGPQRLNRLDPQFDTIAGGTWMDETLTMKQGVQQQRAWTFRDGHMPLMTHQESNGIAVSNHPDFINKLMVLQPVILPVTNDAGWSDWTTANAMFISIMEEVSAAEMKVRLQFNGVELKGYGAAVGMPVKYAPEEVTLT